MSHISSSFNSSFLVRDVHGHYQPATANQIIDAARQVIDLQLQRGAVFTSPLLVRHYLQVKLGGFEHEVFAVLLLDVQNRLIDYVELFRGTIDSAAVYPREVVKETLSRNASAVIFAHNHPSGSPEPSRADEQLTQRLKEALALVGVRVLDHIIVAGTLTMSFAESGRL